MKKVLIFSTAYLPFVGGAEIAVKEITDRIRDCQFDLITARFKSSLSSFERIGNMNIYRLGIGVPILDKLFLPLFGAVLALRLKKKNHYDYFWCLMVTFASGAAYLANLINFWRPVPIILTLQEGDSEEHFKNRWLGLINLSWRLALKNTKILTVISSYLGERAKQFGFSRQARIIPNGVDLKKFSIFPPEADQPRAGKQFTNKVLRKKFKISDNEKVVITVSRLVKKNGVEDLIEAMCHLPVKVKLIIIGGGELEMDLKSKVSNLKLDDRVIMLGTIENQEIPKYLAMADVFVRPSLSEGLGNSFLEAMAAGVPVIGTPVGGIVDFLLDGETGLVCQVKNPESIAEKVKIYLTDQALTQSIKLRAHKLVVENYDWDSIALKMKNIFEK